MNNITAAERARILAYAQGLQRSGVKPHLAIELVQAKFGISRNRAKSAVAKALTLSRRKRSLNE